MVTTHRTPVDPWIGTEMQWQKRGRATIKADEYEEKGSGDKTNRAHEYNRFQFTGPERKEWDNLRVPDFTDMGHLQELDINQQGLTKHKRQSVFCDFAQERELKVMEVHPEDKYRTCTQTRMKNIPVSIRQGKVVRSMTSVREYDLRDILGRSEEDMPNTPQENWNPASP